MTYPKLPIFNTILNLPIFGIENKIDKINRHMIECIIHLYNDVKRFKYD